MIDPTLKQLIDEAAATTPKDLPKMLDICALLGFHDEFDYISTAHFDLLDAESQRLVRLSQQIAASFSTADLLPNASTAVH